MTNRQRIWTYGLLIALIAAAVLYGPAAWAQTPDDVDIPINTILRGDPGDTFLVATVTASPGLKCDVFLDGRNNKSIHPNTDFLIQSGDNGAAILDIESDAFATGSTSFTSDGLIELYLRLGPDGVSSTGFISTLDCQPHIDEPPPPIDGTTTTTIPTVTTTTTPAVTTTTEPPPIDGPNTGGGACADGACTIGTFSLSPLITWLLLIGGTSAGVLGLLVIVRGQRKQNPPCLLCAEEVVHSGPHYYGTGDANERS